jgi:ssDNA-binding Zn-finger/Zn-ribbon topoisomerase 1
MFIQKEKIMEAFIDSENKIITSCPVCGNQHRLYLIKANNLVSGPQVQYCEICDLPYIVDLKTELKVNIEVFSCKKENL